MLSQGTIIKLRNRLWRVDDYKGDTFSATPINSDVSERTVFLTDIEKFEAAAFQPIHENLVGDLAVQKLLLSAYRFELIHGSAPFLSLHRSSVVPYNYQMVPLVMSMEKRFCRMLLADDVGLGKTIEAGLIISELIQRGKIRKILILVPASLKEQWKECLDYFFHLDSRIISSYSRKEFERELPAGMDPWQFFNICIASVDYAKSADVRYSILKMKWDFVIVDEVHACAKPHASSSGSIHQMKRYELIKEVTSMINNVLFLTATPHNGYTDSFASILEMLNPAVIEYRSNEIIIHKKRARYNVCQRNRKSLEAWYLSQQQKSPFPDRNQDDVILKPNPGEPYMTLIERVENYGDQLIGRKYDSKRKERVATWVALHLQKRAISSPFALQQSLENRLNQKVPLADLLREEEDYMFSVNDHDPGERLADETLGHKVDQSLVDEDEKEQIMDLLQLCKKMKPGDDLKLKKLKSELIPDLFSFDSKIILFTKYKDTLDYLLKHITSNEYEVFYMHGEFSSAKRKEVFLKFERSAKAILIATDVISEGLNLQHLASNLIHYELPWNPNRLEQRNGRIDRIGQKKETLQIRTLIIDNTMDRDILDLLLRKAQTIRKNRDYSGAYFGDEENLANLVQYARRKRRKKHEADPGQLSIFKAPEPQLTKEALQKSFIDPYSDEIMDRIERESFYNEMNVNLPEIDKRIEKTLEIVGSRDQVRDFVISALRKLHCDALLINDGLYKLIINDKRLILPSFGNIIEPVTFDPEKALTHPDLVMMEAGHPFVRRLIEIIKSDFFENEGQYGRTAYYYSDQVRSVNIVYHALVRFTIGITDKRVIEEMVVFGIDLLTNRPLTKEQIDTLNPSATHLRPLAEQLTEYYSKGLHHEKLEFLFQSSIDERRKSLIHERLELQQKILKETSSAEESAWIREIAVVEEASHDLLTLTVVLPNPIES
ncbi:MAG: helicase-related protein [Bacteroidetes bacterium]|nr:helicase-related protein [Bacteroidota bacterium]